MWRYDTIPDVVLYDIMSCYSVYIYIYIYIYTDRSMWSTDDALLRSAPESESNDNNYE